MRNDLTTIERAIQLARDSSCTSVADIRRMLTSERYDGVEQHLSGTTIKKQLAEMIAKRQAAARKED
jgi:hypothetical protein